MRNQKAADLDVRKYLPTIIQSKHKATRATLTNLRDKVFDLCDGYDNAIDAMTPPPKQPWKEEESAALESCYGIGTMALSAHKDNILWALKVQSEVNLQRCAYCMLNDPRTWDHYLPKESFPEYAVYHANLLYICFGCNHRKSKHYHNAYLLYCHPYFSVDADTALLHCLVTVVEGTLAIKYYCAGMGAMQAAAEVAQRHLEGLGLIDRFAAEASSMLSGLIGELRQYFPDGVPAASLHRVLQRRYSEAQECLGINAWDSRLWHGVAHCVDFLDYVNDRIKFRSTLDSNGFYVPAPPAA
ncbi:hypothetical protein [Achromobacter pestifer]|uniref:HNH endonuclease n=1 Tax=Achromobacter pestifer TaxID=1353889 RepID=A0A6S6YUW0_9BURK|nr:hypothetical protein [Achromobacter pestifer]CAB3643269.1 hypothetical protein LMG3431_02309 [Achromobacter pestifer]